MKYAISNICRVDPKTIDRIMTVVEGDIQFGKDEQVIDIPPEVLKPRQVTIDYRENASGLCGVTLKPHRDSWIPVIEYKVAKHLVADKVASWEKQRLLIYDLDHYMNDSQVTAEEKNRIQNIDCDVVVIGVIGGHRGINAAVRNIVDGLIEQDGMRGHCIDAWSGRNTFLVED